MFVAKSQVQMFKVGSFFFFHNFLSQQLLFFLDSTISVSGFHSYTKLVPESAVKNEWAVMKREKWYSQPWKSASMLREEE